MAETDATLSSPRPAGNRWTRMSKAKRIGLVAGSVFVAVLVAGLIWVLVPPSARAYEDPIDPAAQARNTALRNTLLTLGLENPFIVETDEGYLAAYDLPPSANDTVAAEQLQRVVLGAMVSIHPDAPAYAAVAFLDGEPFVSWSVDGDAMRAFAQGEMDEDTFEAAIAKEYPTQP